MGKVSPLYAKYYRRWRAARAAGDLDGYRALKREYILERMRAELERLEARTRELEALLK